jgi:hypothetical protein
VNVVPASTSIEPTQQACSQLVSQVLGAYQLPDDPELRSVALIGLNSALNLINSRQWKKIYGTAEITLNTSDREYEVPDDFKDPIRLFLLNSAGQKAGILRFLTEDQFYQEFYLQTASAGSLCTYTFDYNGRVIVLDQVPSSSVISQYPTLQTRYHRRVPKLNCTGTTGLPPEFDEFLVARGAVWLARVKDPQSARFWLDEASERWRMLLRDDGNIQTDYQ